MVTKTIKVTEPVPLVLAKPPKLKPAKRRKTGWRLQERKQEKRLRELYNEMRAKRELSVEEHFIPMFPLVEGETVRYRQFSELPEVDIKKMMSGGES